MLAYHYTDDITVLYKNVEAVDIRKYKNIPIATRVQQQLFLSHRKTQDRSLCDFRVFVSRLYSKITVRVRMCV